MHLEVIKTSVSDALPSVNFVLVYAETSLSTAQLKKMGATYSKRASRRLLNGSAKLSALFFCQARLPVCLPNRTQLAAVNT